MPGIGCKALNSTQLVIGCDFHAQIPPPSPAPHVVTYCIGFAAADTTKMSLSVMAGPGNALGRAHDIGMGMYHFAPNALLPLVWAGAANKAEFASSSVQIDSGRMALAVVPVVGINMQLDCNEPCAAPTSVCIASFNTVEAGFTLADCMAGLGGMLSDTALTFLAGKVTGLVSKGAAAGLEKMLSKIGTGAPVLLVGVAMAAFPKVATYVEGITSTVIGWAVGSPLGHSFSWAPGSKLGSDANDAITEYLSPTPTPPASPKALPAPESSTSDPDSGDE